MDKNTFTFVSTDTHIATIRILRDSRIHELLQHEDKLQLFLEKHCDVIAISPVRKQFLKKDLMELKMSGLDLTHYSSLLKESKASGSVRPDRMDELFILEFQLLFDKYKF